MKNRVKGNQAYNYGEMLVSMILCRSIAVDVFQLWTYPFFVAIINEKSWVFYQVLQFISILFDLLAPNARIIVRLYLLQSPEKSSILNLGH
jgi:hypothetical protein